MIAVHHIISNPETMSITVGPMRFDRPVLGRFPEMWTHVKAQICGPSDHNDLKGMYQHYARLLGPKFNRRFQAANYWLWIGNRMSDRVGNMLRHEGRHWKQYNDDLVFGANEALPYVNEAERDGLLHLIPIIITFGEPPQKIKRRVGQGVWRRAAANSLTRNCLLMNAVRRRRAEMELDDAFARLLEVPSGVIRAIQLGDEEEFIAARLTHKKRIEDYTETLHLVRDTMRMLGRQFNPNWSLTRVIIEHNAAVRESYSRKYSNKRFADECLIERAGFTARLLTSKLEIATEGATQHHCVGSYAGMAAGGSYAVFQIDGKERATAGLQSNKGTWRVDQVYAACNRTVSQECMDFARFVASQYPARIRRAA